MRTRFAATTRELESEGPDHVQLTIGANPILAETPFGIYNMGCAVWSDISGEYRTLHQQVFDKAHLAEGLQGLPAPEYPSTHRAVPLSPLR